MSAPTKNDPVSVISAGILVADLFVPPLSRLPESGELLLTDDFLLDSGGCAANTATCLAKLDVSAMVMGRVGNDHFGNFIAEDLRAKGANVAGVVRSHTHGTSKTVILPVVGQDRRYIHTFGANSDFSTSDIDRQLLSQSRVFYLGGYLAMPGLKAGDLAELFQFARRHHVITVLDVIVSADAGGSQWDELTEVLPYTDYFMPNELEGSLLTGEVEPHRQAESLRAKGCRNVIVTLGAKGALFVNEEQTIEASAFPIEVIDGSGAGDAFAAGFIFGLLHGWPLAESLRFASAMGASACRRLGCTTGVFNRQEAEAYIREHSLSITA